MNESLDTALEKINSARIRIRNEIGATGAKITQLEQENIFLPKQIASFGEVKKSILALVAAAGERYAKTYIRAAIIDFAKGASRDPGDMRKYGQPLTLGELNGAINGEIFPMANTGFLSGGAANLGDLVLYAVQPLAVQETLTKLLDQLAPSDLGLNNLGVETEITLDQMNERIAANLAEINLLKSRKTQLENELKKLS